MKADCRESVIRLGTHLYLPLPGRFLDQDALLQLFELVVITFVVAIVILFRRLASPAKFRRGRAGRIVKALHGRLLDQSLRRAEIEGAAAQHVHAEALIGNDLPEMQSVLSLWYRAIPRTILVFVGCVTVALLVNVWLALLAVVSGVLVWQLYQKLHESERTEAVTLGSPADTQTNGGTGWDKPRCLPACRRRG